MGEPERKQFWIKVSLVILFLFSAANIFLMLFIVPKFEQIFADALPGAPLPTITVFIISVRIALAIAALGWTILGSFLVWLRKPTAILWINIGILCLFLEIGITIYALILPMFMPAGGMSDAPSSKS